MKTADLAERLRQRFSEVVEARGEVTVVVAPDELHSTMRFLRDGDLAFGFLVDVTASDWLDLSPRFWLAYHLLSIQHSHRVRVKVGVAEPDPRVASVVPLFPAANWYEREVFDLFGITFDGHPDLRRIEMPDNWEGHPLRKDYGIGGVTTPYKGGAYIEAPDQRGR